ncbi:MAG: hypothetical protein NVS2B7_25190 [Herpetosiphon sp.]
MSEYRFNVATLLQEPTGSTRRYELDDEQLDLGDGMVVRPIQGGVHLTRTVKGVLADVVVSGTVNMECARCLTPVLVPLTFPFMEEFYQTVVVNTGAALPPPEEPDVFLINETHKLDLEPAMREYAVLHLPMMPLCRNECKGICPHCGRTLNEGPCDCQDDVVDERLEALKILLKEPKEQ